MNTFYIVRHGETENNIAGRLSGWVDSPLTERGLEPTAKANEKLVSLKFDAIYSSDFGRAFMTAYEIARGLNLTHEIKRMAGLREVNYGDAGNMFRDEAYKLYPRLDRDTTYLPPHGESLECMQRRVLQTIAGIDARHTDETILIVVHSGTIAAIRASFLNVDFGEHNISEAYPHDYVGTFTMQNGKIASFNQI